MDNKASKAVLTQEGVLQCQSCAAKLSSKDAWHQFQQLVFDCQYCGSENRFSHEQLSASSQKTTKPNIKQSLKQILATRPKDIIVKETSGKLTIDYHWRSDMKSSIISFMAPLAWVAVIVFHSIKTHQFSFIFLFFYFVGGLAVYRGLMKLFNKANIVFDKQSMQIMHGPLPSFGKKAKQWPKRLCLPISTIANVSLVKFSKNSKLAQITIELIDGNRLSLFKKSLHRSEAQFILDRIERYIPQSRP